MKLYSSNEEAVNAATNLLSTFPNLHHVVAGDDLASFWLGYLKKKSIDVHNLLDKDKVLTLFSVSVILSFARNRGITNPFVSPYEGMLSSLDRALGILSGSENLESFRFKLRNPEGTQTISCFSELFLAEHFFNKGFAVSFEYPFQIEFPNKKPEKRDFDISIASNGRSHFVEVYTPVSVLHGGEIVEGFLGESFPDFVARIKHKAADKFAFGRGGSIKAPNYPKVLAVNARYYDSVSFELVLGLQNSQLAKELHSMFSETFPVDGIIIFQINDSDPSMPIQFHHLEFNNQTRVLGNGV